MLKFCDLFCGAGGFSLGFKQAGFEGLLAVDIFAPVLETYSFNLPRFPVLVRDIRGLHSFEILDEYGFPDIVIASPPCEPFSAANKRRMKRQLDRLFLDELGGLVLEAVRLIGDLEPKVFILENVVPLASPKLKEALKKELLRVGFPNVFFNVLYAEDFGTPSKRMRLFISNIRLNIKTLARKPITVVKAIDDLPDPESLHAVANHDFWEPMKVHKKKKVYNIRWGDGLTFFQGASGKGLKNWIRLHPYKLAPTVLGKSRFIHPFWNRLLTVREHARLMGFPDDFVFFGGRGLQFDQVGEAVPPPLARAIAEYVKFYIKNS
ncbi:MAG: DNA cytosine methyltransferase [Candidatus Hodarchaeota archaeon]